MRAVSTSLALAIGLTLAGCGNMASNRSLESVNQPVVTRTNYALDLETRGGGLPSDQQRKLAEWFEAMDLGYGDRIAIDDPTPGGNAATRAMVEAVASRYGLLVGDYAPVTAGTIAPGDVRVVVTRSRAEVPGCPNWDSKAELNPLNATSTNYGCSVNGNLASMVADPEDLVRGEEGDDTSDAATSGKAIKTYRDTPPTGVGGLKQNSTQSGGGQ